MNQDRLVYELRAAIDRERTSPSTPNRQLIARLVTENLSQLQSKHVLHNLGRGRVDWLATHALTAIEGIAVNLNKALTVHPFEISGMAAAHGKIACSVCGKPDYHPIHGAGRGQMITGDITPADTVKKEDVRGRG